MTHVQRMASSDHRTVSRSGIRASSGPITAAAVLGRGENGATGGAKVGYAINRHAGGAVVRNRIRRRLRSHIQRLDQRILPGSRVVIAANKRAFSMTALELGQHLERALRKTGALN